ncbi:pyridoxamine 5'-phosphate oxidase [Parvularcula marina]|uniref:Pyridoxine/pyridoxamine 5'-phosphate oxidase n=1 Tax=Parvularcula marina TaxID=2292771 RepID=A0A371RL04_9PROT|nr:pyridoxamine 5'-phosphate oxidase [Parvularcula marina]RFB06114.1 pyridoxamine 5'-phosphate oxidase [Parvularcula marina]
MDTSDLIPPSPSEDDYEQERRAQEAFSVDEDQGKVFTSDDPLELFAQWLELAKKHEVNDAHAMSVATVDGAGFPNVRVVLLKDLDEGFVFYTNSMSAKGDELAENPLAALCFHWKSIRRQVRIRGLVEPVSEAENDQYFASRARSAQIGAWASQQSRPMTEEGILQKRVEDYEAIYEGRDVRRPDWWRGYRVTPSQMEFWVNRPFRLHDRLQFDYDGEGWNKTRLYP